ncbi:hypothetical protein N7535_008045 [Penicillium sp. DV-2018c]|nr:hypothetical protein N7461_004081 [Penicillium sp. DV-2018c]KAJ5566407.1 hypothetical protein N7535_008045 [Penicillium sp. DV-2018c]
MLRKPFSFGDLHASSTSVTVKTRLDDREKTPSPALAAADCLWFVVSNTTCVKLNRSLLEEEQDVVERCICIFD